MIRGGHVDVAILGALQLDARGRIANWSLPGRPILGVGGAMDLLVGAPRVIVATTHLAKDGAPKIVQDASFPLTADRPVDLIVTEHATFAVGDDGLTLIDVAAASSVAWVEQHTGARFSIEPELTMQPSKEAVR
jgi:3-oxoacid CoA-transferase B subunit